MKFMKQLVALTAAMAICSTTVSTSVSAKSFYSVHEGYYNENLTEEIVTEEEISVEETIPAEEEAVPADDIPEETVPEDVVPEEAPQDEPAAPAQEETTIVEESNGTNTITVIDNGYAKIPAALVYSKQVQLKDNSLEVVWGAVVSLAIIPNSPYESSKITVTVTDDNGRIVNGTYKKGYIKDSASEQYVDMYMVFVQSNLTVELTYRDEIPVTILPCEHGTITYEIDSSKLGSPNILFTAHPDEGYGTRNIVIHDAKGQLVGSAKFPYSIA